MGNYTIKEEHIVKFAQSLKEQEYAEESIKKYVRDIRNLKKWLRNRQIDKELLVQWKAYLLNRKHQPKTINGMLSSLNCFFKFMGWDELQIKYLKIQRTLFRSTRDRKSVV